MPKASLSADPAEPPRPGLAARRIAPGHSPPGCTSGSQTLSPARILPSKSVAPAADDTRRGRASHLNAAYSLNMQASGQFLRLGRNCRSRPSSPSRTPKRRRRSVHAMRRTGACSPARASVAPARDAAFRHRPATTNGRRQTDDARARCSGPGRDRWPGGQATFRTSPSTASINARCSATMAGRCASRSRMNCTSTWRGPWEAPIASSPTSAMA